MLNRGCDGAVVWCRVVSWCGVLRASCVRCRVASGRCQGPDRGTGNGKRETGTEERGRYNNRSFLAVLTSHTTKLNKRIPSVLTISENEMAARTSSARSTSHRKPEAGRQLYVPHVRLAVTDIQALRRANGQVNIYEGNARTLDFALRHVIYTYEADELSSVLAESFTRPTLPDKARQQRYRQVAFTD